MFFNIIKITLTALLFLIPIHKKPYKVLKHCDYETNKKIIDNLLKYYNYCQEYRKLPGHFKFTLKENAKFNYLIFINIKYINSNLILYIIDETILYLTAR